MYFIDCDLNRGGAPISTLILSDEISKHYKDINISVVMPKVNNIKVNTHINVIQVEKFNDYFPHVFLQPLKWLILCKELYKIIKVNKPDIIHAQMPRAGFAIGLLKKLNLIDKSIKLIYTDREHVAYLKPYHRFQYKFLIANIFQQIVVLSEVNKKYWSRISNKSLVEKVYNTAGKQFENFDVEYYENTNIRSNKLKLIFVGRMVYDKNWPLAASIIRKIDPNKIDITVVISYFNSEQEMKCREYIQSLKESNINIRFVLNGNQVELSKYYYEADILLITSIHESFGRTAVEAMSRKCVVISTNVGGLPEVVGKKENILALDSTMFLDRINYYIENREQLELDKEFFLNRYFSKFTNQINIKKHYNLYTDDFKNRRD
jgi:glycosyltransferase involved in cell wall biosynthesis